MSALTQRPVTDPSGAKPQVQPLDYRLGPQIGASARLGLIALQSDERIEADFRSVLPAGDSVGAFVSRIPSSADVTPESLAAMETDLSQAAALLPPSIPFDVIGYGCTSASSVIGADRVAERIRAGCPAQHVTNPLSALIAACQHLGTGKIAVLTPYLAEVTQGLTRVLEASAITCSDVGAYEESAEARVARIDPESTFDAACALMSQSAAQALFLSCTNLNTFGLINRLEAKLQRPVLSSNQVLFWHMAHLADAPLSGPGALFR